MANLLEGSVSKAGNAIRIIIWLRNGPFCVGLVRDSRYDTLLTRMNLPATM